MPCIIVHRHWVAAHVVSGSCCEWYIWATIDSKNAIVIIDKRLLMSCIGALGWHYAGGVETYVEFATIGWPGRAGLNAGLELGHGSLIAYQSLDLVQVLSFVRHRGLIWWLELSSLFTSHPWYLTQFAFKSASLMSINKIGWRHWHRQRRENRLRLRVEWRQILGWWEHIATALQLFYRSKLRLATQWS